MLNKILLLFIICLMLNSCDYYDSRLKISNNSDKTICYEYDLDTVLDVATQYKKEYLLSNSIMPNETRSVTLPGSTDMWIRRVMSSVDTTLSIFIFDYETVNSSNWDSLRHNNLYEQRLDFKLYELEKMEWNIFVD
jgi:hypothetical protein